MEQIIYLEVDDDIAIVRDRLRRAQSKHLLLVIPPGCKALTRSLDLRLLRRQAAALGINLELAEKIADPGLKDDTDTRIAWIVDVGLKDLNPTRILKACTHLVFEYSGALGIPAQMLGLHSAQRKLLGCTLHLEHGMASSFLLDDAYKDFSERYCASCPDIEPHPDDWIFTEPWYNRQIEILEKASEKAEKRNN